MKRKSNRRMPFWVPLLVLLVLVGCAGNGAGSERETAKDASSARVESDGTEVNGERSRADNRDHVQEARTSDAQSDTRSDTRSDDRKPDAGESQNGEEAAPTLNAAVSAKGGAQENDEKEQSKEIDVETEEMTMETKSFEAAGENFDPAAALSRQEQGDSVQFVFYNLPKNKEQLEALIGIYPLQDPDNTAAFLFASLVRYVEEPAEGIAMLNVLHGPRPLSKVDENFLRDRLMDKLYLPRAYFSGATPDNNYTPSEPWTLVIYKDPVAAPEGYIYRMAETAGADSRRRIQLRIKGDTHYLWEYPGILSGIRLPAEENPWS